MIKNLKALAVILSASLFTSLCNTVSANTPLEQIKKLLDSGKSTMEVLDELSKTDEYNDISCKITVKPGTKLTKIEEYHHLEEAPYDNVYYINGSPQILMQYGDQENVVSIEIRLPQTDAEYKKDLIALYRKILSEPHTEENAPYLILDLDESADIGDALISNSRVIYTQSFPESKGMRYYIEAPTEVLSQYLEWYESTEVPYLKFFTITVPAEPANTGEVFYPIGDVNHDTFIDITDLTELSLYLLGDRTLTEDKLMLADVDFDEKVTLADLAKLQQYLSKKINSLR